MSTSSYPLPGSTLPLSAAANAIFAGPVSGGPATAAFRVAQLGDVQAWCGTQTANRVFAGPASGAVALPDFRALVPLDLASGGSATNFYRGDGTFATPVGSAVGITVGKDRNRPAAAGSNIFQTSDTFQTYISDQTQWYLAGSGWDKVSLGRTLTGGMGDNYHLDGPPLASGAGPEFTNPYTFAIGFYVVSLPGAVNNVMAGYGAGNTNGWYLAVSTVNANKLAFKYIGVNASAVTEMSSMAALTVGWHVFVMNYDAANVRYVLDGGTVNTVAATGAATALSSASKFEIGAWHGGAGAGSPLWFEISFAQGYASKLSDADMQTLGSALTTFRPGVITADPAYYWAAEFFRDGEVSTASSVSTLPAYGTASSRNTYLTPVGSGGGIKTRY